MIALGRKIIRQINFDSGHKKMVEIRKAGRLLWSALSSCFSGGHWSSKQPWRNNERWRN